MAFWEIPQSHFKTVWKLVWPFQKLMRAPSGPLLLSRSETSFRTMFLPWRSVFALSSKSSWIRLPRVFCPKLKKLLSLTAEIALAKSSGKSPQQGAIAYCKHTRERILSSRKRIVAPEKRDGCYPWSKQKNSTVAVL